MSIGPPAPLSHDVFRRRRDQVIQGLGDGAMVLPAAPVRYRSRDTEYPHRPDSELYWLTGVTEPDAVAVIRGAGADPGFVLFVRDRDAEAELWAGPRLGPDGAAERFGADEAYPVSELADRLPALISEVPEVWFRLGQHPRVEPHLITALGKARLRGARKGTGPRAVRDPGSILDDLRLRKDAHELELMRRAAAITVEAFRALAARLRPGIGEWELQGVLDGTFRAGGGEGAAYESIVASGANACVLHYVANDRRTEDHDLVLVDAGASLGLYAADLTRTLPVSGRFSSDQAALYDIVESARQAAVDTVAPGATVAAVHQSALQVIAQGLVDLDLLSGSAEDVIAAEAYKPFFPHQTSHWLGLDVHDVGDYARDGASRVLEPGMVLTVEPGLYMGPGALEAAGDAARRFAGIGIRVEDDVVVTDGGREILTGSFPSDRREIETLLAGE